MWVYEKKLQYPVKIKKPDPRMAQVILSQYGGAYSKCLSLAPLCKGSCQRSWLRDCTNAAKTRILVFFRLLQFP